MNNEIKILSALKQALPGHNVECVLDACTNCKLVYVDNELVGFFEGYFFTKDFDNPEIEIKIKAPLKSIEKFIQNGGFTTQIRLGVERGLKEWREESRRNN